MDRIEIELKKNAVRNLGKREETDDEKYTKLQLLVFVGNF